MYAVNAGTCRENHLMCSAGFGVYLIQQLPCISCYTLNFLGGLQLLVTLVFIITNKASRSVRQDFLTGSVLYRRGNGSSSHGQSLINNLTVAKPRQPLEGFFFAIPNLIYKKLSLESPLLKTHRETCTIFKYPVSKGLLKVREVMLFQHFPAHFTG